MLHRSVSERVTSDPRKGRAAAAGAVLPGYNTTRVMGRCGLQNAMMLENRVGWDLRGGWNKGQLEEGGNKGGGREGAE